MDYAKLKNAELESLLKERNLPHTGKKAEMVSRLQDDDRQKASKSTPAPPPSSKTSDATTAPAVAALANGDIKRVVNSVAVSNQTPAEDPSKSNNLTATKDTESTALAAPVAPAISAEAKKAADEASYTSNLPATDLEAELEKRKARAKKFGIVETESEAIKALERAKRFGTGAEGENAALGAKLDAALPERGSHKRSRGGAEGDASRDGKRRRGGGAPATSNAPLGGRPAAAGRAQSNGGDRNEHGWMSAKDREAAEKRKARFAATT